MDRVAMAGLFLDDVTKNWNLAGIRTSRMKNSSGYKQSEFVQLDHITNKWNFAGSRSCRMIHQSKKQTDRSRPTPITLENLEDT